MSDKPRELIWVPAELAEAYNKSESDAEQERLIRELINKKALDFTRENELLEEQELIFKGACLAHRNALRAVYEEENEKLDQLFYDIGDIGAGINKSAKAFAGKLAPITVEVANLRKEVQALKDQLSSLQLYGLDELTRVMGTLQHMSAGTKELLSGVLNASRTTEDAE